MKTEDEVRSQDYLRPREVCRILGISLRTLSEWRRRRIIPYHKVSHRVVLFRLRDVDRALERFRIKSIGEDDA